MFLSSSSSPGLQEFLESLSFTYYLEHGILISYSDVLLFLDVRLCVKLNGHRALVLDWRRICAD